MLSRVADSLYWMSRYLERADHTARLVEVNLNLTLDQAPGASGQRWFRLQACLMPAPVDAASTDHSASARAIAFNLAHKASFATCLAAARENARAILACLAAARENARHVRERISSEMWEQMNRLYLDTRAASLGSGWEEQPHGFFRQVREGAHLFHGITDGTMRHDQGWHFAQVGRYLERAAATAALVDVQAGDLMTGARRPDRETYLEWVGLLRCCAAFEAYCRFYSAEVSPERVLAFLFLEAELPYALRYSVEQVSQSLRAISEVTGHRGARAERLAGRLLASLQYQTIDEILASGLHLFLADLQRDCARIHEALRQAYVETHTAVPVA